jgi:ADP-ribose pyrophosphatase YjhB (NUDIX family)
VGARQWTRGIRRDAGAGCASEAREETGLEVEILGVVDTFHYYRGAAREEAIGIAFHCRPVGGALRMSAEHDAADWVPLERLSDLPVGEPLRTCLATFARRRGD